MFDKELIIDFVKKIGKLILVNDVYKIGGFIGEIVIMVVESEVFDYFDYFIVCFVSEDVLVLYLCVFE